jgi:hypothetical protein
MATFYVLPSRDQLGERCGELLGSMFPGIRHTPWDWPDLAESLVGLIEDQADAHVVFREDFDDGLSVRDSLLRDFGAELSDEIIEVHFGPALHQFLHQPWATERARRAA